MQKGDSVILGGLVGLTILSAGILMTVNTVADGDASVSTASVTVAESCSMVATTDSAHTATIPNGIYSGSSDYYPDGIGQTTLKVYCNDVAGFSIYAVGYTGEQYSGEDHTKLIGTDNTNKIVTGIADSGQTSNWAMKLATNAQATYPITLENGYGSFSAIPDTYTKVATRAGSTDVGDIATGASLTTTYAAYISPTQLADTYTGKVKYTMVHPASEEPLIPQPSTAGYINYYANASTAVGTMGRQSASDGATVKLFASNFSRDGYGFAGWSDAFDYATNTNANFYGPNEGITVPTGTTANGLSLYAVWIKSAGDMQDTAKTTSVCNGLTAATAGGTRTLASVSALTDIRDGQTYAIAKLADNKCWMIENLRLADTHQEGASTVPTTLTTTNTNNPLNDGTNVTLKLNYNDTTTATHLSPTSSVAYDATTAPEGWCNTTSAACYDQSRLRTDNTANRVSYTTTDTMSIDANLYSYGNYYNWYSATAGNGTYSKSSGNSTGDLCPTGWHLPTGNTTGEYYAMNTAVSGGSTSSDAGLRSYPNNFLRSGYVAGASLVYRGSDGYYWSSTARNSYYAYDLYFGSSFVSPGTVSSSKNGGRAVRCLVSPGA